MVTDACNKEIAQQATVFIDIPLAHYCQFTPMKRKGDSLYSHEK